MRILGLDSSSLSCSCAIVEDGILLSESYIKNGLTHSRTLNSIVRKTLEQAEIDISSIDYFAISEGPGSYTGLRIGMAELKGMAFACNKKCIPVSTLLSLCQNVIYHNGDVISVLDARANQFYYAIFNIKDGVITRITEDTAQNINDFASIVPQNALAVGDGAKLLSQKLPDKKLVVAPEHLLYQRASSVAFLANPNLAQSVEEISLNYHRKSQAEREREQKENENRIGQ